MSWDVVTIPPDARPPTPLTVRAQTLPARTSFAEHSHQWGQAVHAISGALAVRLPDQSFVISPSEAVWLPVGTPHRVGSLFGAEFRSLWVAAQQKRPRIFAITPLLHALIEEAEILQGERNQRDMEGAWQT